MQGPQAELEAEAWRVVEIAFAGGLDEVAIALAVSALTVMILLEVAAAAASLARIIHEGLCRW